MRCTPAGGERPGQAGRAWLKGFARLENFAVFGPLWEPQWRHGSTVAFSHDREADPTSLSRMAQVRRVRSLHLLENAKDRRLTLVVAPAGFGKSSLMNQHFEELRKQAQQVAWLTLEPDDRSAMQFLLQLVGALIVAKVIPSTVQDYSCLSTQHLTSLIVYHLQRLRRPLYLFFDDYHFAQSEENDAILARLLLSPMTQNLRLLILSRSEPRLAVSAMQLNGQLTYLKASDLRFSAVETQTLLAMAGVKLEKQHVERLVEKTEGWAVALQLSRVLLRDGAVTERQLLEFSGTQLDMARYLSDQVFSTLTPNVQAALIEVAPLPQFNTELVAELTGPAPAEELTHEIFSGALPIEIVDETSRQFKLHAVLQEFLLREAVSRGCDLRQTRRRAAQWYAARENWSNAIRHALLAEDFELAGTLSEKAGGWRLVYAGAGGLLPQFHALTAALPEVEASRFPRTFLGLSVAAAKSGNISLAMHYFGLVSRAFDRADQLLASEVRLIEALMSLYRDDRFEALDLSLLERDLTVLGLTEPVQRGLTYNLLCFQSLERSEFERTERYGSLAQQSFKKAGAHFGAMHIPIHVGQARFFCGDMEGAGAIYELLTNEAQNSIGKGCDMDAIGRTLVAETLSERGLHAGAERILQWSLPHLEKNDCWFDLLAAAYLSSVRARMSANDVDGVDAVLDQARRTAERRRFPRLQRLVAREQMRSIVNRSDIDGARRFAERFDLGPETAFDTERNRLSCRLRGEIPCTLWVRIWMLEGQAHRALDVLQRLEQLQEKPLSVPRKLRLRLLAVLAANRAGNGHVVRSLLDEILLTLPTATYRSAFFEEGPDVPALLKTYAGEAGPDSLIARRVAQILAPADPAEPGMPADDAKQGAQALTPQELKVMSLICGGFSNKEIAKHTSVSENTVKFHIRNVFSKLNVHSRTSAIAVARELGLLT